MEQLTINSSSRTYPIYFDNSFSGLYDAINGINKKYSSFIIITDSNVKALYSDIIVQSLKNFEKEVLVMDFIAGEKNKTLDTIQDFYRKMIAFGADRKSLIIALGGGVTGDMAGFLASTYMRGVDFVQIPTSLLAQVDSSVGGKTGIDFDGYKNVVGAFYQPMFVYINVSTLKTLPPREFSAGMSEVIKHGFIKDFEYYEFLKRNVAGILKLNEALLITMIKQSCAIKKSIVDLDETELGARALLNFGHTFGHSIERLKDFELIHGECVAIGMHGALKLSELLGYISAEELEDGLDLIKAYNLPITVSGIHSDVLYQEMFHDKKTTNKRLVFAILKDIGSSFLNVDTIDENVVYTCMEQIIEH